MEYKNCGLVIQAHRDSVRLPNKINLSIGNTTMLQRVLNACYWTLADKIIVATTSNPSNDCIVDTVQKFNEVLMLDNENKITVFRYHGDEADVLSRYYLCAKEYKIDYIIRITSDCPLHISGLIDLIVKTFLYSKCEYMNFSAVDGLDVEIFTFGALQRTYNEVNSLINIDKQKKNYYEEHVTTYIKESGKFNCKRFEEIKSSVDTTEDLSRVREICKITKQ